MELLLGIAANLCCHTQLAPALAADSVFVEAVVATLLSCAYAPALTEACRALEAALASGCPGAWAAALLRPAALERLVWVAENTRVDDLRNRCDMLVKCALNRLCTARALHALGPAADIMSRPDQALKYWLQHCQCQQRARQVSTSSSESDAQLQYRRSLGILAALAGSEAAPDDAVGSSAAARVMRAGAAPLAAGLLGSALAQRQGGSAAGGWEEDARAGEASLDSMLAVLALLQARSYTFGSEAGQGMQWRLWEALLLPCWAGPAVM